jgi:hypothetical protein
MSHLAFRRDTGEEAVIAQLPPRWIAGNAALC